MRSAEILDQLDSAAENFVFPDLGHGYFYAVDARLHAYRDAQRWALVVEAVGYSPRAGNLTDVLYVFGNCLTEGEPGLDNGGRAGRNPLPRADVPGLIPMTGARPGRPGPCGGHLCQLR